MAWNDCYGYNFNTGACINYGDSHIYPGQFHGYQGGQDNPGGGNAANPPTSNAPGGPTTGFPGAGQANPLPGSGNAAVGGAVLDDGAIFWLALIGIVLLVS